MVDTQQIEPIECGTAREFVDILDPSHTKWTKDGWGNEWIFRGQADKNWELVPSAHRTDHEQMMIGHNHRNRMIMNTQMFLNSGKYDARQYVASYGDEYVRRLLIQLFSEITNLREFFALADSLSLSNSLPVSSDFLTFGSDFVYEYMSCLENGDYMRKLWGNSAIAIAQHHGVATRLLDWTKTPYMQHFLPVKK